MTKPTLAQLKKRPALWWCEITYVLRISYIEPKKKGKKK